MKPFYRPPFKKYVKRQARPLQLSIEDEIEKILENPEMGETKKRDLGEFRVHKFAFKKQKLIIAYQVLTNEILFYMVGPHENFYRNLKKYVKEGD
jgi:plasmid stabilization system protein ParE